MLRVSLQSLQATVPSSGASTVLRLRTTPSQELLGAGAAFQLRSLRSFLHNAAAADQWAAALKSVKDALRHDVKLGRKEYDALFERLAAARQPAIAAHVVKELTDRKICSLKMQSMVLRPALLRVFASSGDFDRSRELVSSLLQPRDERQPEAPLTSAELQNAMDAALTALRRTKRARDNTGKPIWEAAMGLFVQCRMHPASRDSALLTAELVHRACRLLEVGGNWHAAIAVLSAADRRQIAIEGETLDSVVRSAFAAEKHHHVVRVIERCVAANTSPHEATVRLGIVACDEVSSYSPTAWALACQLIQALSDNGLPILPATYETVVRCCATSAAGRWDTALTVAACMVQEGVAAPQHLLKLAVAKRIEHCSTFAEAKRFSQLPIFTPVQGKSDTVMTLALLRCAVNLRDWDAYRRISKRFIESEMPITNEKLLLQMEASYLLGEPIRVVTQFVKLADRILHLFKTDSPRQGTSKLFPVYHCDAYIPPAIWRILDQSIARLEQEAPKIEILQTAKMLAEKLARLRQISEVTFAPGEVDLHESSLLLSGAKNVEAEPAWAYSAEERRAMHPERGE